MSRVMNKMIVLLCAAGILFAQTPSSSVWSLTANQSAIVNGDLTALDQQLSAMQILYSSGVQRSSPTGTAGTWTAETAENSSRFMQFTVFPKTNFYFTVLSVSLKLYVNSGSGMRANVYYSKDSAFTTKTQIGTTITLTTAVPGTANITASPNVNVNLGEVFYVRIYPWNIGTTTGKYVITNSVNISGTTLSATSVLTSVNLLNQFVQLSNTPSTAQNYTVTGMGLTNEVMITPPVNFEISTDSGSTWSGNSAPVSLMVNNGTISGQPFPISVRMNAMNAGVDSGKIIHTSTGAPNIEVKVVGVRLAEEPSIVSSLSFSQVTGNSMSLGFTGGNGGRRIVVMRGGDSVTWVPTDGVPVNGVDSNFSIATDQGNGNKIVYDGSGTTLNISGLSSNVQYYFSIFEYNSASGNSQNYLTSISASGTKTTTAVPTLSLSTASLSFGMVLVNTISTELTYSLSGAYLSPDTGKITITVPSGFEISLTSSTGFLTTLQIPYSAGTLNSKIIYVRFKPTSLTGYNDTIVHLGGSAQGVEVAVSGTGVSGTVFANTPIGYATLNGGTTGGAGGSVTTVTTLAELEAFAKTCENNVNPKILYISGKISSASTTTITIKHGANISIYGTGNFGELENVGLVIWDYKNVIVRNMKIHEVLYPNDALSIDECENVWIDHNELYSKIGAGIGVDTYDGLLDIKNGSRYVTVSWNYLHHHMKCSLIGHTDNTGQQATDSQMRITYHHNFFSNTDGRNPSIRFGAIHMFNNYFENLSDYGIAARDGAHAKIENSIYHNVLLPMSTDKFPVSGLPNGYICESGNIFSGTSGANVISQTGCDFWDSSSLPYSYTLDPVGSVENIVKLMAGIGIVTSVNGEMPVGITSFTASFNGKNIELRWNTATETNNAGFEVQKYINDSWVKLGFVEGAGTANSEHNYSFTDTYPSFWSYAYRLKQIDRDGKFAFSNVVEGVTDLSNQGFVLLQNYPNPFNPSTTIQFGVEKDQHVSLIIFNALGQKIETLFSGIAEKGKLYSAQFNAESFSSGIYFGVLENGSKRSIKKLLLMK